MKRIIKSILILFSVVLLLSFFLIIFDMAEYDNSYVNRKALVLDMENLNNKHLQRKIFILKKNFINY